MPHLCSAGAAALALLVLSPPASAEAKALLPLDLALSEDEGGEASTCHALDEGLGLLQTGKNRMNLKVVPNAPAHAPGHATSLLFRVPGPQEIDRSVFPVVWLHVPECGSSFLNALTRIPGACHGLPQDLVISTQTMGGEDIVNAFWARYPTDYYCPQIGKYYNGRGQHRGIATVEEFEETWDGKGVTILRRPEQRLLSAFHDFWHSWPLTLNNSLPADVHIFAQQVQGCAVKQLTRFGVSHQVPEVPFIGSTKGDHWGGPCGEGPPPTQAEVEEAKRRLRHFKFVGLQEEWQLSMCLFHATFGGPCHPSEFVNSRRVLDAKPVYDEASLLGGWTDVFDGALYSEAETMFWSHFEAHGLSLELCQPCFQQAGITYP